LRLLLVTLALGFVASRAYRALLPVAATRSYSPFDALGAARTTPAAPHALRKRTAELGAANEARRARHTAIPRPVRWAIIDVTAVGYRRGQRSPSAEQARRHTRGLGGAVSSPTEIVAAREANPVARTAGAAQRLLAGVEKAVVGKRDVLELVLAGLLADGHVLLDDVPGVAKTLMARSFAAAAGLDFSRVQFTPDVLPADITGATVLDLATNQP